MEGGTEKYNFLKFNIFFLALASYRIRSTNFASTLTLSIFSDIKIKE